ncbi:MAG: site-2 protease family protein [Desulfamplus sp.]|nr:site-2 protease family protein [Desulfamplus sp.]
MTPLSPSPDSLPIPTGFSLIDVPFILNFSSPEFDKIIIFVVAVLLSISVNAEAQAFMATILGDIRSGAKDRFHFNPLLHINLAGLICFATAGFGWPKQIELDTDKFKHPAIAVIMVKLAGVFGNLLLASIAGSIVFVMKKWNLEDQVFSIVVSVNVMIFVYNIIPIPPLAGASLISCLGHVLFPVHLNKNKTLEYFSRSIPYIFVGTLIIMRINGWPFLNDSLNSVVKSMFRFIAG